MKNFLFFCAGLALGYKAKDWFAEWQDKGGNQNLTREIDEKIAELDALTAVS